MYTGTCSVARCRVPGFVASFIRLSCLYNSEEEDDDDDDNDDNNNNNNNNNNHMRQCEIMEQMQRYKQYKN